MSLGRRLAFGAAAVACLLLGAVGIVVLTIMLDESRRAPDAFSSGLLGSFALMLLGTAAAVGALTGLAFVPERVLLARSQGAFAAATALVALALVLAVPSPLALFTWPLAVVAMVGAITLFRRVLRARPQAK